MFKIIPQNDEKVIDTYLSACCAKRREGSFVYAMLDYDTNELMGVTQFEIGDKISYIYDAKELPGKNDFEAMFILIRQTMNFIEKCGIEKCIATKEAASEQLLRAAGFKPEDGAFLAILAGMFDGNCHNHTHN